MDMIKDEIMDSIGQIPMLPTTIQRIMTIVNDPQADMNMLARVVEEDPTLAMQALRLCNSAYYSLPVEVTSITHAVRFLGTDTVGGLAMAAHFQGLMQSGRKKTNPWLRGAEKHLLTTGQIAEKLARIGGGIVSPATAFTAGLLHDVGKLVFSKLDSVYVDKVYNLVREKGAALIDAEGEILGMDHAEVGALLSEKWELPKIISEAVRHHHSPRSAEFVSTLYVYLANELFYIIDRNEDVDAFCHQPDIEKIIEDAGLTIDQLHTNF
jgi:putative nucleotidyltransferase with HDIG domain